MWFISQFLLPLTLPFWWKGLFLSGSKEMHFSDFFLHGMMAMTLEGIATKIAFHTKKYDACHTFVKSDSTSNIELDRMLEYGEF